MSANIDELPTPAPPGAYTFSPALAGTPYLQSEGPLEAAGRQLQGAAVADVPSDDGRLTPTLASAAAAPQLSKDVPQPTAATMLSSSASPVSDAGVSADAALAAAFLAQTDLNKSDAAQALEQPQLVPLRPAGADIGEPTSNLAAPAADLPVATAVDDTQAEPDLSRREISPKPVSADNVSNHAVAGAPLVLPEPSAAAPPVRSPVDELGRTSAQRLADEVSGPSRQVEQSSDLPPPVTRYTPLYAGAGAAAVGGATAISTHDADVDNDQAIPADLHVHGDPADVDGGNYQAPVASQPRSQEPTYEPQEYSHRLRDFAAVGGVAAGGAAIGAGALAREARDPAEPRSIGTGLPEAEQLKPVNPNPGASGLTAMNAQERPTESLAAVERHALPNQTAIGNTPLATAVPAQTATQLASSGEHVADPALVDDAHKGPKGLKALGYSPQPASEQRADPPRPHHHHEHAPSSPRQAAAAHHTAAPSPPRQAAAVTHSSHEHSPRASHEGRQSGEHHRKLHTHRHPHGPPPEGIAPPTPPKDDHSKPPATGRPEARRRSSVSSLSKKSSGFFKKVFHKKDKSETEH